MTFLYFGLKLKFNEKEISQKNVSAKKKNFYIIYIFFIINDFVNVNFVRYFLYVHFDCSENRIKVALKGISCIKI